MIMACSISHTQHLSSARAIGIGGYTALAGDLNALDWNPAGLAGLVDWQIEAGNFVSPTLSDHTLTAQLAGLGKRFLDNYAAAFRVSPGITLDFTVPSTFTFEDSSRSLTTRFDKKISYSEPYAFGFAVRVPEDLALGLSVHRFENQVSDTRFSVDSNSIIQSTPVEYSAGMFLADIGLSWSPGAGLRFGVVAKNLIQVTGSRLPEDERQYELMLPRYVRFGAGCAVTDGLLVSADGDTKSQFRVGGEWSGPERLLLRGGLYADGSSTLSADAISFGAGGAFGALTLDASYLKFFSETNRKGSAEIGAYQQADIASLEYNRFTGDRVTLTAQVSFGGIRPIPIHIDRVDMGGDFFPALTPVYAYRPVGRAIVRNTSTKPIEAKLGFFIDKVMDAPTETKPERIPAGDTLGVPFYAVFNDSLRASRSMTVRNGDVTITAADGDGRYDDRYQSRVLIHARNDWNGDVSVLRYFVTPDDSDVIRFTRSYLNHYKALLDTVPGELSALARARIIFDEFAQQLLYVNDPKKSEDFVQYPSETLRIRGGDCDDMSVCYAALLASMGISAAFVDVVPPGHPGDSHIYLMFDSGISPPGASLVAGNPKRYVIRGNDRGAESVWIPVETTAITKGFEEAWRTGAQEYFNDVEVNLGMVKGWVRVVDLVTVD
jgi:hypothetical protein